ncbi:MAG: hypothetical protein QOD73_3238 [Solirubrobacteraceae bacterium]|nr:hypothetical protein [Solirubrobacteraceae bacterium]
MFHVRRNDSRDAALAFRGMADDFAGDDGVRRRLTRSGEDALGRLAQELLENPLVSGALARALGAREKAAQAQEVAMGVLNLPSAADVERVTRRVRSVSQRLEGIEDGVDRLDERLAAVSATAGLDGRLQAIEQHLQAMTRELAAISAALPAKPKPRARPAAARAPRAAAKAPKE